MPTVLIIHESSRHTPCFQLSSHIAPGGFLNITIAHVFGRKEVSILKKRKFLSLAMGFEIDYPLHSAMAQWSSVLKGKREINAGLFPPC